MERVVHSSVCIVNVEQVNAGWDAIWVYRLLISEQWQAVKVDCYSRFHNFLKHVQLLPQSKILIFSQVYFIEIRDKIYYIIIRNQRRLVQQFSRLYSVMTIGIMTLYPQKKLPIKGECCWKIVIREVYLKSRILFENESPACFMFNFISVAKSRNAT